MRANIKRDQKQAYDITVLKKVMDTLMDKILKIVETC